MFAHKLCALFVPETFIVEDSSGGESISGIENVPPARWNLVCIPFSFYSFIDICM
jgi:hypothetical protein